MHVLRKMTSSNGNIFAQLTLWEGNPPVTGGFPPQRPVTQSFDVSFDLRLNKRLSKQSRCRRYGMPSRSLWRHCNYAPSTGSSLLHTYISNIESHIFEICLIWNIMDMWKCTKLVRYFVPVNVETHLSSESTRYSGKSRHGIKIIYFQIMDKIFCGITKGTTKNI